MNGYKSSVGSQTHATLVAADPRTARRAVALTLAGWGLNDLAEDAELVVAEMAMNAVGHGGGIESITMEYDHDRLRIEVADANSRLPRVIRSTSVAQTETAGGRGLRIVEALSTNWGWRLRPPGKIVWAELAPTGLSPSPAVPPGRR